MKLFRTAVLVGLLVMPVGCCAVDPATGVSIDEYKAAITRIRDNLQTNIRPAVAAVMSADATHSKEWKEAKLGLIDDTVVLANDVLAGKNAGKTDGDQ